LTGGGFWGWDSDGVHLLCGGVESDSWDFPFSEGNIVSIFTDFDIENGSDSWEFDISLEFLRPEIGEILSVINTIFDHQLTAKGPNSSKVKLVF
jgi:hypothetical protein